MSAVKISLLAVAYISLTTATVAVAQTQDSSVHSFRVETFAEGLERPWSMAFLPNGDMLVTEQRGTLRLIQNGVLLEDPVAVIDDVRTGIGAGGLYEVVLHPDFATNNKLYLSYARNSADGSQGTTVVVTGRWHNERLVDLEDIFVSTDWSDKPIIGARVVLDDDGHLFLSIGDRMSGASLRPGERDFTEDLEGHPAQDPSNHRGAILRLNLDGSIPDDNPFVGRDGFLPEIWSYGHRNPQGLVYDAETGKLWETEHGPNGGDELNDIQPGRNYGWPVIGYGKNYGSGKEIHMTRSRAGMEQPAAFWVPSIAPSGLMVYDGDAFENWQGNLFAGGLAPMHRRLSRVIVNDGIVQTREPLLMGDYRIRDVRVGPDGLIYIATSNQLGGLTSIIRLVPEE